MGNAIQCFRKMTSFEATRFYPSCNDVIQQTLPVIHFAFQICEECTCMFTRIITEMLSDLARFAYLMGLTLARSGSWRLHFKNVVSLFLFAFSFWCCVVGFVFVFCFGFLQGSGGSDCSSIFVQALLRTDFPSDMPRPWKSCLLFTYFKCIHIIVENGDSAVNHSSIGLSSANLVVHKKLRENDMKS